MTTEVFFRTLEIFCRLYGASITSTHRTVKHNRDVGGAAGSLHLGWKAADLVFDDWSCKERVIDDLKSLGLFVLDETADKNHLHVDDRLNA